ncbi:TetR/AcrR family transcriptional regulator [Amycolatopsis taiwanensis]|uniref:TetR family transcriptional regulator n=1 Tax=Amycolatopsis taiwanensis TaxID=342230 RepID=A0A9W6R379_9PSEU|nr:TetR/AcrR family transcriptional regulator [Amycolatopsis taiwanensis]GLY68433.1 TetR family transcriptional regulator [Amycolatopsis taiwanensis]
MPRPRSLTHTGIATAALAVLDSDGLDGLTMRAVAKELGVGTMSLYRYVTDRDQLEGLVVDLVLDGLDLTVPARASAAKRLAILAERIHETVGAHPAVVPLLVSRRHLSAGTRRWGEAVLGVLAEAGFTGKRRVIAFRTLMSYVLGALQAAVLGALSGAGTTALAELPAEDFPFLADTARHARNVPAKEEFRRGVEIVIRGLDLP